MKEKSTNEKVNKKKQNIIFLIIVLPIILILIMLFWLVLRPVIIKAETPINNSNIVVNAYEHWNDSEPTYRIITNGVGSSYTKYMVIDLSNGNTVATYNRTDSLIGAFGLLDSYNAPFIEIVGGYIRDTIYYWTITGTLTEPTELYITDWELYTRLDNNIGWFLSDEGSYYLYEYNGGTTQEQLNYWYEYGYQIGYQIGISNPDTGITWYNFIPSIIGAEFNYLGILGNFEIFGFSILTLLSIMLGIALIGLVIKLI